MCLHIDPNNNTLHTADKDIVCYKVVLAKYGKHGTPAFISDYYDFIYTLGKEYAEERFQTAPYGNGTIALGFHSFNKLKNAVAEAEESNYDYALLRCIIPAGARYWDGEDALGVAKERCSEKIRVVGWKRLRATRWHYAPGYKIKD